MLSPTQKKGFCFQFISFIQLFVFIASTIFSPCLTRAQNVEGLPVVGTMVRPSEAFTPVMLRAVKVDIDNPMILDFIVDKGESELSGSSLEIETHRLIKYFLTALTIPEKDIWVNLSPYEKDRITADKFGQTEMGRDLLEQDYILKQLTATLAYPETQLGKEFWNRVYARAKEKYGDTQIPMDGFNKVWIMPDKAVVYEKNGVAYVVSNHLKILTEQDYLALGSNKAGAEEAVPEESRVTNEVSSQAVRDVLIPEITREINEGKNFATLRQIYNALLLAAWYKVKVKNSILNIAFANKSKTAGNEIEDKSIKEKIYTQYVNAFKKGVYNYVHEDVDEANNEVIPRKYFSGGALVNFTDEFEQASAGKPAGVTTVSSLPRNAVASASHSFSARVRMDAAMNNGKDEYPFNILSVEDQTDFKRLLSVSRETREAFTRGAVSKIDESIDTSENGSAYKAATVYLSNTLYPPVMPRTGVSIKVMRVKDGVLPLGYALDRDTGNIYLSENFEMKDRFDFLTRKVIFMLSPNPDIGREKEYHYALTKSSAAIKKLFPKETAEPYEIIKRLDGQILLPRPMTPAELKAKAIEITGNPKIETEDEVTQAERDVNIEALKRAERMLYLIGVSALDRVTDYSNPVKSLEEMKAASHRIMAAQLSSKFAPISIAHMVVTILTTYALTGVNTFYVNVSKVDPRKPEVETSFDARYELAVQVINDFFGGLVQVLPDNEKIAQWNGEEVLIEMLKEAQVPNGDGKHRFTYTAGGDHFFVFAPYDFKNDSVPLIALDKVTPETLKYYTYYMQLNWDAYKELIRMQQGDSARKIFQEPDSQNLSVVNALNAGGVTRADLIYRMELFQKVILHATFEQFHIWIDERMQKDGYVYLPRLDTVGKLYIAQKTENVGNKAEIILAHTNRKEEYRPDKVRDALIERKDVAVLNIPGLQGSIAATQTRRGLQEFVRTQGRRFSYKLLYGNVIPLLRAVLSPEKRSLLYLFLRQEQEGAETPMSLRVLLPSQEDSPTKRQEALGALQKKHANTLGRTIAERFEKWTEKNKKGEEEDHYSSVVEVKENDKVIASLEYIIIGQFKSGKEVNILKVRSAKGEGDVVRDLLGYAKTMNDAAQVVDASQETDLAAPVVSRDSLGGIDFDINGDDLSIQSDGSGINFKLDPAMLQKGNFEGLVPVIINFTPVSDLPVFLGIRREDIGVEGAVS